MAEALPRETATTVVSRRTGLREVQEARRLGDRSGGGWRSIVGAGCAALAVGALLFGRLAAFSGVIGFVVVVYALFLVLYGILVSIEDDRLVVFDRLVTVVLYSAAAVLCLALGAVLVFVALRGWSAMVHTNFYFEDLRSTGPKDPLGAGGVKHAIVGSVISIGIALLLTVPLGLTAALYLNLSRGPMVRFVRTVVEAMTALPSVVAGLFVFATWILFFGQEKAAMGGALAISVDMLPIIIRSADVILRLVPGNLLEASASLGAPRWRTALFVVLPTARSGLATAVILGTARGIGETAPVLLTVGYTKATNFDALHGPMVTLPLVALELVRSGEPLLTARAYGAGALLLLMVLALFITARVLGGRGPGVLTHRQERRLQRSSVKDANRIISRYEVPVVLPVGESDGVSLGPS